MKTLLSSLGLVCAVVAPAMADDSLTLDAALTRAAARPQLTLTQLDIGAAIDAKERSTIPIYNPVVSVEAGPQFGQIPTSPAISLGIDQTIERGGKRDARKQVANRQYDVATAMRSDGLRNARLATWRAFQLALIAQQRLAVLVNVEKLATELVDIAKRGQTAGGTTQLRVNALLAERGRAVQQRASAELDLNNALSMLAREIGAGPDESISPVGDIVRISLPKTNASVVKHSALAVASANVDRSLAELHIADAESVPDISIGLGYSYQSAPETTHAIVARISIPLAIRSHNDAARGVAHASVTKAKAVQTLIATDLSRRVAASMRRLQIAVAAIETFDSAITANLTDNLSLAQSAFSRGAIDFAELTITQRDLVAARLAYFDTQIAAMEAWVEYLDATGTDVQP
jgi:outer membrane protein, heavy metal efflux system